MGIYAVHRLALCEEQTPYEWADTVTRQPMSRHNHAACVLLHGKNNPADMCIQENNVAAMHAATKGSETACSHFC